MFCPNCGASTSNTGNFCDQCGKPLNMGSGLDTLRMIAQNAQAEADKQTRVVDAAKNAANEVPKPEPVRVILVSVPGDKTFVNKFYGHLNPLEMNGFIVRETQFLNDQLVGFLMKNASQSKIVLIPMLSPDFFSLRESYDLFTETEFLRRTSTFALIPMVLRPCDFFESPYQDLMAIPARAQPVSTWNNLDEAYVDAVKRIKSVVFGMLK